MKKYVIMFLLFATQITYSMNYFNDWWRGYVEWRNPEIINKFKSDPDAKEKISTIIDENYEKPLYIKALSAITPLESEESIVKGMYIDLDTIFKDTFYPGKAKRNFLISKEQLPDDLLKKLKTIEESIVNGKNGKGNKTDFYTLKDNIKQFVTDLKTKIGKDIENRITNRLNEFIENLETLSKRLDSPPMTAIERWHRNRVADRIKNYFNLK